MSFSLDLAKFAEKAKDRADTLVRDVVAYSVGQIDQRSPVGDPTTWKHPAPKGYIGGHFRASWQLDSNGQTPTGIIATIDPSDSTMLANITAIPKDAAGRLYIYANNAPYARRLEDGWSPQSPPGAMVGLTVIDARNYAETRAAELAR